jgi:hypothetical protein
MMTKDKAESLARYLKEIKERLAKPVPAAKEKRAAQLKEFLKKDEIRVTRQLEEEKLVTKK